MLCTPDRSPRAQRHSGRDALGPDDCRSNVPMICDVSDGKLPGQSLRRGRVLQLRIVGKATLEWWIGFTNDEWRQIAASCLCDAEAVGADEVRRQQLLPVGDLRKWRLDNVPPIGLIAKPADRW